MFLLRRPSAEAIGRFLQHSANLPLSYAPAGLVVPQSGNQAVPEWTFVIGRGTSDFERARDTIVQWKQFELGWVEVFPRRASIATGTVVAVLIRHLGFWSLNGCRLLYRVGDDSDAMRFGFAYGTLTNHAESGEELFEVFMDPRSKNVGYRIRAVSRPRAAIALVGRPIVRFLQNRFRDDSAAAMRRATGSLGARR